MDWAIVAVLLLVTLAVYFPVRHFDFINYDDPDYVAQNPVVQRGLTWGGVKWAFTSAYSFNWHPATWLSHMLDCQFFGPKPGAHHMMNLVFHLANTALLFVVFRKMTRMLWPSAFVAAVFALHPLHVESVAWVCERKDVLSTFFWLLTMGAYTFYVQFKVQGSKFKVLSCGAALLFFTLGLMSKPMLVTLPFVLLLLDFWPLQRISTSNLKLQTSNVRQLLIEKIPLLALAIGSSVVTFLVQRSEGAVADMQTFPIAVRLGNVPISYVRYLGKAFWPKGLTIFYPYPEAWPIGPVMAATLLLLAISAAILWRTRKFPFLFVGWFWFLGTLVPVIGIVQVGLQSMADRYTYVPMIGLSILVAWSAVELAKRNLPAKRFVLGIPAFATVIALAALARNQIQHWQNSITIFEHAVKVMPDNIMAHVQLGNAYSESGQADQAILHFNEALKRSPRFAEVHYNLGNLYLQQRDADNAIDHYQQAIQLRPDFADAHANLAVALGAKKQFADAVSHYELALKGHPNDPDLLQNLSRDLITLQRFDAATARVQQAMAIKPNDPALLVLLGDIAAHQNHFNEAADYYQKALALNPQLAEVRAKLDWLARQASATNTKQ